jgi:hypothetical protein
VSAIVRSVVLGGAFVVGIAIAANADRVCRVGAGSCRSPGSQTAALPPDNAVQPGEVMLPEVHVSAPRPRGGYVTVPYVNAFGFKTMVTHYVAPSSYDTNAAMHPYTSGLGPWPGPGTWGTFQAGSKSASHYNR